MRERERERRHNTHAAANARAACNTHTRARIHTHRHALTYRDGQEKELSHMCTQDKSKGLHNHIYCETTTSLCPELWLFCPLYEKVTLTNNRIIKFMKCWSNNDHKNFPNCLKENIFFGKRLRFRIQKLHSWFKTIKTRNMCPISVYSRISSNKIAKMNVYWWTDKNLVKSHISMLKESERAKQPKI